MPHCVHRKGSVAQNGNRPQATKVNAGMIMPILMSKFDQGRAPTALQDSDLHAPNKCRTAIDRALCRILAEIHDGLRHGYFEYVLSCELIGQERRRLTLRAGKSHQFIIPKQDCTQSQPADSGNRSGTPHSSDARIVGPTDARQARLGKPTEPQLPVADGTLER
jgi:hypothetical protein